MFTKCIHLIILLLCTFDANSQKLKMLFSLENDSIWIGGPIYVKLQIVSKLKKTKIVCDPNLLTMYVIKKENENQWRPLQRTSNRFGHNNYEMKIRPNDTIFTMQELEVGHESSWRKESVLLQPNEVYVIRAIFPLEDPYWSNSRFDANHLPKKKYMYVDKKFRVAGITEQEKSALKWIDEHSFLSIFACASCMINLKREEEVLIRTEFIEKYRDTRFLDWALFPLFRSKIMTYKWDKPKVVDMNDVKEGIRLGEILSKSKVAYFQNYAIEYLPYIKFYQKNE